jgi:hypothetical protein
MKPNGKLEIINSDKPLTEEVILTFFVSGSSILLLLRSEKGDEKRGGYFFNMVSEDEGETIEFFTMDNKPIWEKVGLAKALRLINHVSGREFDKEMLAVCQTTINFREDEESA